MQRVVVDQIEAEIGRVDGAVGEGDAVIDAEIVGPADPGGRRQQGVFPVGEHQHLDIGDGIAAVRRTRPQIGDDIADNGIVGEIAGEIDHVIAGAAIDAVGAAQAGGTADGVVAIAAEQRGAARIGQAVIAVAAVEQALALQGVVAGIAVRRAGADDGIVARAAMQQAAAVQHVVIRHRRVGRIGAVAVKGAGAVEGILPIAADQRAGAVDIVVAVLSVE